MLVAVVDDEPLWLRTMSRILSRNGFDALLIGDPAEAVDRIVAERPAVVVLDGQMPGISGIELARRLRAALGDECPRLVLVSGDVGGLAHDASSFTAVYQKPVPFDSLTALLRDIAASS